MAMFNSYVKLTEGKSTINRLGHVPVRYVSHYQRENNVFRYVLVVRLILFNGLRIKGKNNTTYRKD